MVWPLCPPDRRTHAGCPNWGVSSVTLNRSRANAVLDDTDRMSSRWIASIPVRICLKKQSRAGPGTIIVRSGETRIARKPLMLAGQNLFARRR